MKIKINYKKTSLFLIILLLIIAWGNIFIVKNESLIDVFSKKNLSFTIDFINQLLGVNTDNKAFFNIIKWKEFFKLTVKTLEMSILAIGFASIFMFLTVLFGANNFVSGDLTGKSNIIFKTFYYIIRILYIFSRSIPEILWALIVIFILKPGIIPGAIALSIHNYGILGKLCSDVIEDLDSRPLKNLKASGANTLQLFSYGIFPLVLPKFLTYIIFRWEIIIRTTIVVGFVGAGGLGRAFRLKMSYFHYTDVTLIIFFYLVLVNIADLLSNGLRKWINT